MELGITLNTSEYESEGNVEFTPLKPGNYKMLINSAGVMDKPAGKTLKVEMQVVEGENKDRKMFDFINYIHTSENHERIERERMSDLYQLCGQAEMKSTTDLLNKVIDVQLKIDTYQGKASNKVHWYGKGKDTATETPAPTTGATTEKAPWG